MPADLLIEWLTWQIIAAVLHSATLILTCLGFTIITVWIHRLRIDYNKIKERLDDQKP
jgi:hypothetical protein